MSAAAYGSAIQLDAITKTYGSGARATKIIDSLSLCVAQGEFVSILGPSGCGKTTVLNLIAGLVPADGGRVFVDENEVLAPQRSVGIVFQSPALLRWRTVLENVLLPTEILGMERDVGRRRALEVLQLVGLEEARNQYPAQLSGGMQQRVGIARALAHDPSILLLDEPFSALDPVTRNQLNLTLLRIWSERRKTSLLITHSIPEAVFVSDRIFVLSGRPACLLATVPVTLPRPRTQGMRLTATFTETVNTIGRLVGLEYL